MRRAHLVGLVVSALALSACSGEDEAKSARSPLDPYPSTGVIREFDFTVEDVLWEVGPGAVYEAVAYDGQVPGPPIEVGAGDRVVVHLTNASSQPASLHTHVSAFAAESDGTGDGIAEPGESVTMTWDALYPGTFPYHDHADEVDGMAHGLFGAVIVHAPEEVPATEHVVVLADFVQSDYVQLPGTLDPGETTDVGTYRGGHQYMHTFNGKAYGDGIPPFLGQVGDLQRWRIVSVGLEFHTFHIHGHRWLDATGVLTDNVFLMPGGYTTFEFLEDNPGDWPVHCHVPDHMEGGMMAEYVVSP
ncbi:MAG: multicopper oxidase domain-containing protein [Myxococcales bacterium]|nr:multicopper oxidase domain-containing protein [Myxococcales bacterium]